MLLQLIKLDEHARTRIPTSGPTPAKTYIEEKPQQEKTSTTIKQAEDTINDRINSRVSSLMSEIQEIENRYTKATQEDQTQIKAQTYTQPSIIMSTESEKINERLRNLESRFNNLNVRKSQLASELTDITTSIAALKQTRAAKDLNYPRRGVFALGISAIILGLLILFPIKPPFLLQYIVGVGFALVGGGIMIDSVWAYFERRAHR
jgi:predicted  nucleic acid-binding Zn-ribbon protein